ncbi:hypothetical protein EYF80_029724 [Liparis tanakae]|uniref:Uncharacterized protein n=1 Tax=Liparis tanakae TaxID=230148 RepID=A0A4Z2H437_9TELE|nr:hypothetical protein EYF80_029724 [Liparis tanakae]
MKKMNIGSLRIGRARPHLSVDHMFWPRAIGPVLLSAGPLWIAAGRSHRWTQRGSAGGLADISAAWQHITESHQEDFSLIH